MNAEYTKLVVNGFGSFGTPRNMRTLGSTSYRNKMEATSRAFMQAYLPFMEEHDLELQQDNAPIHRSEET